MHLYATNGQAPNLSGSTLVLVGTSQLRQHACTAGISCASEHSSTPPQEHISELLRLTIPCTLLIGTLPIVHSQQLPLQTLESWP